MTFATVSSKMITLYDIPSTVPGKAFSPNTFKTRLAVSFKGLPFKTEWLEMPDIEPTMKKLGAEPTGKNVDGSPRYTLPVIHDDATGKFISDSMKIAEYLEATYPDKPSLFPFDAHAPVCLFNEQVSPTVIQPAVFIYMTGMLPKMNPRTIEFFRRTREAVFKKKLEELEPHGEARVAQFAAAKEGFSKLAAIYSSNGGDKPYFYGNVPSYADLILVAYLLWIMTSIGPENPEWKVIEEWDGGRWGNLLKLLTKYNVQA